VYVKWPEDGIWYEASVAAHAAGTPGGGKARLDYAATDETETVALGELVDAKQIAFREARPAGHARVKGELAVARGNSIAAARDSDASDGGSSDSDEDGGGGGEGAAPEPSPRGARKRPPPAAPARRPPPPKRAPAPAFDADARAKLATAIADALQAAVAEAAADGATPSPSLGDPAAVAASIEKAAAAVYGAGSKDYAARIRSLRFNLKDPHNPDLRRRVLAGVLAPGALVRLTPDQLANKELAAWREQAKEVAMRAAVLDEETAATFSTAAAAAAARHGVGGAAVPVDWRDGAAAVGGGGGGAAAPADAPGEPPNEYGGQSEQQAAAQQARCGPLHVSPKASRVRSSETDEVRRGPGGTPSTL